MSLDDGENFGIGNLIGARRAHLAIADFANGTILTEIDRRYGTKRAVPISADSVCASAGTGKVIGQVLVRN